ncbi:MAG: 30S ribosomal protein S9 [Spirochaetia bacterium]|nr:30S ribosomal protein S9 [Spirochaetia bacterium]
MAGKKVAGTGITRVGRRKTSIARVNMVPGTGRVTINGRDAKEFFSIQRLHKAALEGFDITSLGTAYDLNIIVTGGGISGQAGAVRLGLARALQTDKPELRGDLKKAGLLRRDPRMVERKKYGLHKARRGTQFSKR